MLKEFKEFALKGNLVDIAVAFVMGAAFNKVISSFTGGIIAPLIGMILGTEDLTSLKWVVRPAEINDAGEAVIAEVAVMYGAFLANVIDFLIVAFVMFMIIRGINNMKKKEAEASPEPAAPPADIQLLEEIRDLLKK